MVQGARRSVSLLFLCIVVTGAAAYTMAELPPGAPPAADRNRSFSLDDASSVEVHGVAASSATHMGRKGLRLVEAGNVPGEAVAIVKGSELLEGAIEVELAGRPLPGAPEGSRGFVGIAFRVQPEGKQFEAFYLRPTNGRADDQLRRNHSTQYISHPGYPWHKLRAESPGVYESYADLVPGDWTKVRIEFGGTQARLFVHGAAQPCLIVRDLKQAPAAGAVALWIGQGTEAFFRNLRIMPKASPQ